ncbi:MAG TPA: hypothetical protein VGK50_08400 [Coriobacteriia bacterium]
MVDQLIAVSGAVVGLAAGGFVGFTLGRRYRLTSSRGRFWVASAVSLVVGMVVIFAGLVTSLSFVSGSGVGLITGSLNGLRWGMGRLSDVPRKPRGTAADEPRQKSVPDDRGAHPTT